MNTAQWTQNVSFQRWYDQSPEMSRTVKILEAMPPAVQSIIAQAIVDLANRECHANEILQSYKSLGSEKIMALHKSQRKLRALDKNPDTFKAMTYLYVLSTENRELIALKVNELVECIRDYFQHCSENQLSPDEEQIHTVRDSYMAAGKDGARMFLQNIKERFLADIAKTEVVVKPKAKGLDVAEENSGMRIS
ncbi:MAG: hypothetical protein AB7P76_09045 [Candidatus Melainabacteria bacterium]